jgi:broad specificity phosphatase PhoE
MVQKIVLRLSFLSLLIGIYSCNDKSQDREINQQPVYTSFYLIRHAEKDTTDKQNRNPELTTIGKERAKKWAKVFEDVEFDEVYSTDYSRTKMTASPTADVKNLEIKLYDPRTIDTKQFQKTHKGKTMLIVGHSNTTPMIVNEFLGQEKYSEMNEHDNGSLFILQFKDSVLTSDTRLHIN